MYGPFGSSSVASASYASGSTSASYAGTASVILNPYPIDVTGSLFSTLYSVEPPSFQNGNPANTDYSIFFGYNTGFNAGVGGTAKYVVAIGAGAGADNVNGNTNYSNFIGASAGSYSLYASQSNFIGREAGYFAYYAPNSNFIGYQAGAYQSADFTFTNILNGAYSNYIGHQAGIGYYDTTFFATRSPGINNTIIGTNISLPNDTSNYVNLGGVFFISGAYSNTASINPNLGYSSNILTESINTAKVGINLWNPSYSLHVSGTVAFPNLANTSQTNVVTIDTNTGQLFYTASNTIGGGGGSPTPPAPPTNSIQFNSASAFGGSAAFTFISASSTAILTGSLITSGSTQTIGTASFTGSILATGSVDVKGFITASKVLITSSGVNQLTVIGSGSNSNIVDIFGSQGNLLTVNDSLSGSIFAVNDISGRSILDVRSNNTVLLGNYQAPALFTTTQITTTTGVNTIYSIQTSSYDGAFFDYTLISGTNARAGQIMSIWSGSSIRHTETTTTDIGSTSEFIFSVALTAGSASLQVTGSTGAIIKTIIKGI